MIFPAEHYMSWAMMTARNLDWSKSRGATNGYSFFQARNAIYHSLKLLGIEQGSEILVPSYICRAAVDPLAAYGANVGFYSVKEDCSIDLDDIKGRITSRTRAVMVVHYFGFPQPMGALRRLCDSHQLALIEDCAHVLTGESEGRDIGGVGDVAVFSWRKFLPIYDGADLIVNRPAKTHELQMTRESWLFTLKVAANMWDANLSRTRQPLFRATYRGIQTGEAIVRKCLQRYLNRSKMLQADISLPSFDPQTADWPMSRLSGWARKHSKLERIVARRRRNYEVLLEEVSTLQHVRALFPHLPATVCPWVFPVVFPGRTDAHTSLRRTGIPAVTWNGVRPPQLERDCFKTADFLYDNLVFLPIHQNLRDQDIRNMSRYLAALC